MNSQEKRRDTKKLQNKRRRQKWHFLRDCCVAFVGRKMKCEDQGEMEGGRGHVENGMSKSKKQKRKCVRGKTNLWEMRQESVRLAGCCLMDWVVVVEVGGWDWILQVGGQRRSCDMDPLRWLFFPFFFKRKKKLTTEMGDENITKSITSLWRRISLAGR